jgi:hypothetical protein
MKSFQGSWLTKLLHWWLLKFIHIHRAWCTVSFTKPRDIIVHFLIWLWSRLKFVTNLRGVCWRQFQYGMFTSDVINCPMMHFIYICARASSASADRSLRVQTEFSLYDATFMPCMSANLVSAGHAFTSTFALSHNLRTSNSFLWVTQWWNSGQYSCTPLGPFPRACLWRHK